MGNTKIEWAEKTWSPVTGCSKISLGCNNCYAERMSKRLRGRCGYDADEPFKVALHPNRLEEPLRCSKPSTIFVCSMGDLFHPEVPFAYIERVFNIMLHAPQHTFLVLTKRPRTAKMFLDPNLRSDVFKHWPLPNVWLGVTAENQEMADERIPVLLQIPAAIRFVSVEPMIGQADIDSYLIVGADRLGSNMRKGIDWVICGGETGPKARPMHPDWARSLRDQCQTAGVPFFFKQHGEWEPFYDRDKDDPDWRNIPKESPSVCRMNLAGGHGFHGDRVVYFRKVGKKSAGRLLDVREWNEMPEVR